MIKAKLCLRMIIKHHNFKTWESGVTAAYIPLHDTRCRR